MYGFEPRATDIPKNDWYPDGIATDCVRERRQIASVSLGVASIPLFAFAAQLLAIFLIGLLAPQISQRDWYTIVLSTAPMYLVAMPLSVFLFGIGQKHPPPQARRIGFFGLCGLFCICFALTYAGGILGNIVSAVIGLLTGEPPVNELQELTLRTPLWANLLFCGILAPILEELFYRKLVIDRLRRYGDLSAVLVSGLLFGLVHGNFNQFFYAAAIGCVFGYVYVYTGRLRYTVALHMGINLIGGVYSAEMMKLMDVEALAADPIAYFASSPLAVAMYLFYLAVLGFCILIAPIAMVAFWKHIRFQKGEVRLSGRLFARTVLENPAVWIVLIVLVSMFLL